MRKRLIIGMSGASGAPLTIELLKQLQQYKEIIETHLIVTKGAEMTLEQLYALADDFFLNRTKAKIVPIGIDSGDNYYCVNNENGKVYYWSSSEDSYYYIAESIDEFASFFR